MATVDVKTYTPEELLELEDGNRFELEDGQLVEKEMSIWSSYVAGVIFSQLRDFVQTHSPGWVLPEGTSFQCFPDDPGRVRRPDASFISWSRLTPEEAQDQGHGLVAPDLVAEVISPNDLAYKVDQKVTEYLAAGTAVVWVVNPESRTVAVHRASGVSIILREHEELTGDDIIPGFQCRVSDLFVMPPGAPEADSKQ